MESGKAILMRTLRRLVHEVPNRIAQIICNLRHPVPGGWMRIPIAEAFVVDRIFSILPILGLWMLPPGLLLIAYGVPWLRRPTGRFTL